MMTMMMMTMKKKSRAGVNMMILVFLALFYSAVSDVSYTRLNVRKLERELIHQINEAKGVHFYVGVASAHGTTIQSLCYRQGETNTQPFATGCTKPSTHCADQRAKVKYGAKLTKVFYANRFDSKPKVCGIEKSLIAEYRPDVLCLNEKSGQDNCIKTEEGIVYLRIYEENPESTIKEPVITESDALRPGKRTRSMTEDDSQRLSKRMRRPVVLFQML